MIGGIVGIVAMFSVNIIVFAVLRFIIAMCAVGAMLLSHIISKYFLLLTIPCIIPARNETS